MEKPCLSASSRIRGAGADHSMHKGKPDPLYDKEHPKKPAKCYRPADFTYAAVAGTFTCPAGKLW